LKKRLTKNNKSIEKMFHIIEAMAEYKGSMRLVDISSSVQYPNTTVLRMLNSLMSCGYVYQEADTLKYTLSLKFIKIGEAVRSQFGIRDIVRPFLVELCDRCQETACLAIDDNSMVVYIDAIEGTDKILRTLQRIGKSAPMHSTGVGKLLLLNYDTEQLKKYVNKKGLVKLTKNTITDKSKLLTELKKIQKLGYALDNEECEEGAKCIAAPVRDYTGKIIACISFSGTTSRISSDRINKIIDIILDISSKISAQLGYNKNV
jgi:IclR family KDG regulon transcriptional repressor